jgi:hypothetical protein
MGVLDVPAERDCRSLAATVVVTVALYRGERRSR